MLVESVGTSLAVGKLRGGSFSNIKDASLEKWYFFILGFMVEFAAVYMASREVSFFRDNILIVLALTLLADVVLTRVLPDSSVTDWLPVVTLVIWTACAAATMSLTHMRRDLRRQLAVPPPSPPGPQPMFPPDETSENGWRS